MICRDDRSFTYAPLAPVLPPDASPSPEKEWGDPPSPAEIFSTTDLDEFVGTDFSFLRSFVPSNRRPDVHAASQYDPYAEVHLSGVRSVPHVPFALLGSVSRGAEGAASFGVPGFAPEVPFANSDAELYGEPHPKPAVARLERDHVPGSSSDADLYGSLPHAPSPPRGSGNFRSQVDVHHDRQLTRRLDTSTLLYVIPEVSSYSTVYPTGLRLTTL